MGVVRELVAVVMPGGPAFVEVLQRVWDAGDALAPIDPRLPAPAVEKLLAALAPAAVIDEHGDRTVRAGGIPIESGDALVVATSGSTGTPKGVVHTHESVAASARATSRRLKVDPARDKWLCSLSVSHVAGLSVVTRALLTGTRLEVLPGFDADAVEEAALAGATLTTLVPTALDRIDPGLFNRIVVGGAAAPDDLPANCVVSYGMTETGSAVTYDGRALDGAEVRVVGGEIHVRGGMLLRAYRDGTVPTDESGWLATDDAGEIDADGRLVVHGRRGELINSGGENVWPVEVEAVLLQHERVADVAVVGRPDPELGQRVTAIVVPTDPSHPPTLDELRAHVKEHLHPYAAPRGLELAASLPRTLLGKLERTNLQSR